MSDTDNFLTLGISDNLIQNLASISITKPTAVQAQVIPVIAEGEHVVFQSETGTGKTYAYLLPLIQNIENQNKETGESKAVKLIIAAPTYELASQIKQMIQSVSELKAELCIGGAPISRQIELLKKKPAVIVGNPARIIELIHLKKIKTDQIKAIVFDEADRMIVPELKEDTLGLLSLMPPSVQFIACSATINEKTKNAFAAALPKAELPDAAPHNEKGEICGKTDEKIKMIFLPPEDVLRKRITHWAIFAERRDKISTLRQLLNAEKPEKALVFTARSDQVENIVSKLTFKKIKCTGFYSKTDKKKRKAAIDQFRNGKCNVLVTTDLAARGLNITDISHVIQMDLPETDDFFVHRAGRTARAGRTGINVVIGDEFELNKFAALEKRLKITVYPKELYAGKIQTPQL